MSYSPTGPSSASAPGQRDALDFPQGGDFPQEDAVALIDAEGSLLSTLPRPTALMNAEGSFLSTRPPRGTMNRLYDEYFAENQPLPEGLATLVAALQPGADAAWAERAEIGGARWVQGLDEKMLGAWERYSCCLVRHWRGGEEAAKDLYRRRVLSSSRVVGEEGVVCQTQTTRELRCPALFILGEQNRTNQAEERNFLLENCFELAELRGRNAGHFLPIDRPAEFWGLVGQWLGGVVAKESSWGEREESSWGES